MEEIDKKIHRAVTDAILMGKFKTFCDKNFSSEKKTRLRNILSRSTNKIETVKHIMKNEINVDISDDDAGVLLEMITAFINKSPFRKTIPNSIKIALLRSQNNRCAICGTQVDLTSHADHIIPFKYVGDELNDNLQMLCTDCNLRKNASFDYQIKYLLKLI